MIDHITGFEHELIFLESAIVVDASFSSLVAALHNFVVLYSYRDTVATQGMDRHTAEDTELAGVPIPKGSHVHIRYAAATRDPDKFGCPADIDLERRAS